MWKFLDIRQRIYQEKRDDTFADYGISIMNWKKNPYTFIKSIFYIELSAVLVFFLSKTRIRPNTVTLVYAFCGVAGGVLLSIPNNVSIIVALAIFFSKGVLDWSDGTLARMTNRTSVEGAVLDTWGSIINSIGFQAGLGFYVFSRADNIIYLYLIIIIFALRAADIRTCTYQHFATGLINSRQSKDKIKLEPKNSKDILPLDNKKMSDNIARFANFIRNFLDDRARSVDFIILLILIELFVPGFFITWLIIWGFAIKYSIIFLGGVFLAIKRGWIKNTKDAMFNN